MDRLQLKPTRYYARIQESRHTKKTHFNCAKIENNNLLKNVINITQFSIEIEMENSVEKMLYPTTPHCCTFVVKSIFIV